MKDYFDLALLLRDEELDPKQLRSAIEATFARRQMPLPERLPTGLSDAFANDAAKQQQ
jgi:Nucleotidyl transferase AbiEii toxin, Type IV TA system